MKINTNSWHYRLVSLYDFHPRSLCTYFWTVAAVCALTGVLVLMTIALSPILAVVLGIALLSIRWQSNRSNIPREDGLVVAYLRARKRKICPLITYVRSEDEKAN